MTEQQVKAAVRKRDGYKCVRCGMPNAVHRAKYGRSLEIHRIEPGSTYTVDGCATLCIPCHGPQPRRRRYQGDFQTVRIPKELFRRLRVICAIRGTKVGVFVSQALERVVERETPGALDALDAKVATLNRKPPA